MALTDLTRRAVESALREARDADRDVFLANYGFGRARTYFVRWNGREFDSKAIVGAAHGYLPNESPLAPADFSGGERTVAATLEKLGFQVIRRSSRPSVDAEADRERDSPSDASSHEGQGERRRPSADPPYWVFVCNPRKWAIDRFFERRIDHDTWGVRPSDRARFAPGQLGIVRVGTDRRTLAERYGKPRLEPGIYAICEVESAAFDGSGESEGLWATGEGRAPGWPTVRLKYLRTFLQSPLTIARMREKAPELSPWLLNGLEAASFPISADDFRRVLELFGLEPGAVAGDSETAGVSAEDLAVVEQKYLNACPAVKERTSRAIERGTVGALVKRAADFKCQVCEALGRDPLGFMKANGEPYIEAHHVMPVSRREVGSLAASNIMTLCANHHRQMHYGGLQVQILPSTFEFTLDGTKVTIPRLAVYASEPD